MPASEPQPLEPRVPDNDDVTAEPVQPDVLAKADAVLADPEAKVSDLGDARALFQTWIAEVRARQAVTKSVEADSDGHTEPLRTCRKRHRIFP